MKIIIVGQAQGAGIINTGKAVVNVTNVSREPYELPASGNVVLEADNFQVVDNGDGTQGIHVNVTNAGLIAAGGDLGIPGKIGFYGAAGASRAFEMVPSGTLHSGSVAIGQGYGDRATTTFVDAILFRMPSPIAKGDQLIVDGTLEFEDFQHQGRPRRKVKMVINSYQRQKGNKPREGGNAPAGNPPANGGGGFNRPAPANAPASNPPANGGGGFNRPQQPAANAPAQGGGFNRPAPANAPASNPPANGGGGFGRGASSRPPEHNLPEIDINEDEIPF